MRVVCSAFLYLPFVYLRGVPIQRDLTPFAPFLRRFITNKDPFKKMLPVSISIYWHNSSIAEGEN